MNIAWDSFTPWASLVGGLLIGAASVLYILANGRIAGIAGIVGTGLQQLLKGQSPAKDPARWTFILGLIVAAWLWGAFVGMPEIQVDVGTGGMVLAGLLVGVGVRMGSGCTSGHGVCGLSRFSGRSLANVLAFMASGFATVAVLRHVL